jgi:hypothetical protein
VEKGNGWEQVPEITLNKLLTDMVVVNMAYLQVLVAVEQCPGKEYA